jgi:hypothetical protein
VKSTDSSQKALRERSDSDEEPGRCYGYGRG